MIVAYHNIVPEGHRACGDINLHLSQSAFADHLKALAATHDVISLDSLEAAPTGTRPRAIITFDDAYRGAVTAGVSELVKHGLPATIFVAPGLFDLTTWWDEMADPATGAVPPASRESVLWQERGMPRAVGHADDLPPWARIASAAEVLAAARKPGITLGAHSWSHPNLASLPPDELEAELTRPLAWLRSSGASVVSWLAYPYGLRSPEVVAAARACGYAGAVLTEGGWLPSRVPLTMLHELPRVSVPSGISSIGFRLKAAGLLV